MTRFILIISFLILLSSCSSDNKPSSPSEKKPIPGLISKDAEKGISLTDILSGKKSDGININVNGYLWRASLNILSIAPLISTDALGGTIITDWYINKNIKNQRLKITAFIKTSELRSDGIEVKVYIQNFKNNAWSDTYTNSKLANRIEESILNEARNLRNNSSN
tara:strand:- start:147 stop:641 length:495 start_codon:yes stop_codon:yes gene_type:complete